MNKPGKSEMIQGDEAWVRFKEAARICVNTPKCECPFDKSDHPRRGKARASDAFNGEWPKRHRIKMSPYEALGRTGSEL